MRAWALGLLGVLLWSSTASAIDWNDEKGDHFIVYYQKDQNFAKEVLRNAEVYYTHIADDLGYPRYSNFWQWDNRAKVYIYQDEKTFHETTGEAVWSHGMASYSKKEIHTFMGDAGFMNAVLPHEITHLIFRDFVGLGGEIPLWMDEGVAQWEEPEKRALSKKIAYYLVKTGKDFHIQDLTAMNVRKLTDENKVHIFYMQSVTLVDYLIKTYGAQRFTQFCRELRDGKKFNDALSSAYTGLIDNLAELDAKWRKYVTVDPQPEIEIYT